MSERNIKISGLSYNDIRKVVARVPNIQIKRKGDSITYGTVPKNAANFVNFMPFKDGDFKQFNTEEDINSNDYEIELISADDLNWIIKHLLNENILLDLVNKEK